MKFNPDDPGLLAWASSTALPAPERAGILVAVSPANDVLGVWSTENLMRQAERVRAVLRRRVLWAATHDAEEAAELREDLRERYGACRWGQPG